jgi:deoxyribodipyrimidine photolyase-related protein
MTANKALLRNNPRTAMAYRSWDKMQPEIKESILKRGQYCLDNLGSL